MPKKTFFNLDPAKQDQIISQSIKAFSEASYNEVKIARIIKLAGIPRTSFYDYFEDKMDLYAYIMVVISEKKQGYMQAVMTGNFFERLEAYITSGLKFMVHEPELDNISKHFLKDPALIKEVFGQDSMDISATFETMIEDGINEGVIRPDINVSIMARTLNILLSEVMLGGVHDEDKSLEVIITEIKDHLLDFIRYGMASKPS